MGFLWDWACLAAGGVSVCRDGWGSGLEVVGWIIY